MQSSGQPVVLDTDIGTDIDDAYALVFAAVSPEIDLRAVTTANNDVTLRARIATRLLKDLGRADIPVSIGSGPSITPYEERGWIGTEGKGIDLANVFDPAPVPDGASRIAMEVDRAAADGQALTVCTIGAMTNLAIAIQRYPESMKRVSEVVAMASDFGGFGPEHVRIEHNVACDPVAMRVVLDSGLPLKLIGLNVTQRTAMRRDRLEALAEIGGPLAADLVGMHRAWLETIRAESTPMHDGLAVAYLVDPTLLKLSPVHAYVETAGDLHGAMRFEVGGALSHVHVATEVDAARFDELFFRRIYDAVERSITS